MKKILLLLVYCVVFSGTLWAQGIIFEEGSWKEVLAKAKKENKVVFVDVYTSWCGPCKIVAKTVFSQQKVGDYYNQHFLNYKLDGGVGEGPALMKKYDISGYPTFLFLDGDGKVLYRFAGAKNADYFLKVMDMVKVCAKYGGWEKIQTDFKSGKASPEVIRLCYEWANQREKPQILNKYLKTLPDEQLFTIETGKLIEDKLTFYDYDLLNHLIEGRVKLGKQDSDFDYYFTANLNGELNHFLLKAINTGNRERLDELISLKTKLDVICHIQDADCLIHGTNWYYVSEDMIRLYFLWKNKCNEDEFVERFETYMQKTMGTICLDTLVKFRQGYEKMISEEPSLAADLGQVLVEGYKDYIAYMLDFIDYYWRLVPSDKTSRAQCMAWVKFFYDMNPYNTDAFQKGTGLILHMKYKKEAITCVQDALEKQYFLQGKKEDSTSFSRNIQDLKDILRDIKNDKI